MFLLFLEFGFMPHLKHDQHLIHLDQNFTYVDHFDHYRDQDSINQMIDQNEQIMDQTIQPSTSKMNSSGNSKKRGCFPKSATNKLKHWLFQNLTVLKKIIDCLLFFVAHCSVLLVF